jgi:hypothetical protein
MQVNQEIVLEWPDGETLTVWGWLEEFTPGANTDGDVPTRLARYQAEREIEALKGEVVKVYGVVGGKPGDTPAQAVARAIREAKAGLLREVIGTVKTTIVYAQKAKSKAIERGDDTDYLEGWGDALGGLLSTLEDMLRSLEGSDG